MNIFWNPTNKLSQTPSCSLGIRSQREQYNQPVPRPMEQQGEQDRLRGCGQLQLSPDREAVWCLTVMRQIWDKGKSQAGFFFSIYSPVMIIVIITSSVTLLRDYVSASLGRKTRSYALCSKPMGWIKWRESVGNRDYSTHF